MTAKTVAVMLLVAALPITQGCVGRAISEGIEKTLGPTARVLSMEPKWAEKDSRFLAAYRNFELAMPIKSQFSDTPDKFMEYLPIKFNEQLVSKGLPTDKAGKTLEVNVTILAYQPAASYQKALGPTEEVVALVELGDKDSGKLIGKAICIGRTYQSVGLGPKWKAWGLSRAIVDKWISEYYPKEGRKETKETVPPADND